MESFEDATERNKVQLQLIARRDASHLPGVVLPLRCILLASFYEEYGTLTKGTSPV
jgi:hypothetical protein